jgi:oxygen-dependent protoporphyrinogen oxidase
MTPDLDVAIVGAGIAGLTAAEELTRAGLSVRVFEAAHQVGGRMACVRRDGYLLDTGAEQISDLGYDATWQLVDRLGIDRDGIPLIDAPIAMWRDGSAHPGMFDPRGLPGGAGLSPGARLSMARYLAASGLRHGRYDPDRPEHSPLGTRTVAELGRRYHREVHDLMFEPVANTFFGWDTARSAAAPFVNLMLAVGPLPNWRTYADGMDTLARRLADRVDVVTDTRVRQVVAEPDHARLTLEHGEVTARSVLLCVPAPVANRLYANAPDDEREYLDACGFTPMLKVCCLLDRPLAPSPEHPLYALLFPRATEPALAGILVDHHKHPGRAPAGRGLLSLLSAPSTTRDLLDAPDTEVAEVLAAAAERYVPGLRAATTANVVHRFRDGLPEATPTALAKRARFAERPLGPVDYAGDWVLLRPSSEGAVRSAATAAARVLAQRRATQCGAGHCGRADDHAAVEAV